MSDWPNDQLEALNACHIIQEMFEVHVLDASFVVENDDLAHKARELSMAILDMYQSIGRVKSDNGAPE